MKFTDAIQLHKGDEVIVKRTKQVGNVVEVEYLTKEQTANGIQCCSVMLNDGEWYGYLEIK